MKTRRYTVKGRVQGVSFRANTRAKALVLGVQGWVRNRDDGSVEVLARAELEVLAEFESWLRVGPIFAKVDDLRVDQTEIDGEQAGKIEEGFSIRY